MNGKSTDDRRERLAAALRDNLRRRKTRKRDREDAEKDADVPEAPDASEDE